MSSVDVFPVAGSLKCLEMLVCVCTLSWSRRERFFRRHWRLGSCRMCVRRLGLCAGRGRTWVMLNDASRVKDVLCWPA